MDVSSPPPRLSAFREEYGDPPPPDITRKITACVSCRKHKVKCDLQDAGVPCSRCRKRGLSCAVKKSLQMLLEDDATWKDRMDSEVSRLTSRMMRVEERLLLPELSHLASQTQSSVARSSPVLHVPGPSVDSVQTAVFEHEAESWSGIRDDNCGPAAVPAAFVTEVTRHSPNVRATRASQFQQDIISKGVLTLNQAEVLFSQYITKYDNYIYSVLEEGSTLISIRNNSPLLLAAICAVTSLHRVSSEVPYEQCYEEFIQLSASHAFSSRNNLDDIRAMCIGAFWLPDISWSLVSNSVRMATEMHLDRAYRGAIAGDRKAYVAARLYYLVYVCDHQFSIAYGRPPFTGEHEAVLAVEAFLASKFAVEDDARLISQVELWSVSSNVFATFGTDIQLPVPGQLLGKLQKFVLALDGIRLKWNEAFKPHAHIGNYPRKGVSLHYHFAKLHLCSCAFRGISIGRTSSIEMSLEIREIADAAVMSATSILRTINNDREFQAFMSELPLYFDTMIAFASVFLFRISTSYSHAIQVDTSGILLLLRESVKVLEGVASNIRQTHLLARIAGGLKALLTQFEETRNRADNLHSDELQLPDTMDTSMDQFNWPALTSLDGFSMGDYDLLSSHQMTPGFDMWPVDLNDSSLLGRF